MVIIFDGWVSVTHVWDDKQLKTIILVYNYLAYTLLFVCFLIGGERVFFALLPITPAAALFNSSKLFVVSLTCFGFYYSPLTVTFALFTVSYSHALNFLLFFWRYFLRYCSCLHVKYTFRLILCCWFFFFVLFLFFFFL